MNEAHQKIVTAIIKKAERLCPDSLALIGLYGSNATGDLHPKSDLDLLVLIKDERGYALSDTFILDDTDIGYDLYCTTWQMLENDAECPHAHLSKLLDSQILYVKDDRAVPRLTALRNQALAVLSSEKRYEKANLAFENAKKSYADCMLAQDLSSARTYASNAIGYALDTLMLFHGKYFKKGTKRTFEELSALNLPFNIQDLAMSIIVTERIFDLHNALTSMMQTIEKHLISPKEKPSHKNLAGSYEEIYSNWRNKMEEAALTNDIYSSFMNMAAFDSMIKEITKKTEISIPKIMEHFDPHAPKRNASLFDMYLAQYEEIYHEARMKVKRFKNIESFISTYL